MMGLSVIQYVSGDWFGIEYGKITVPKLFRRLQGQKHCIYTLLPWRYCLNDIKGVETEQGPSNY